MPRAGLLLLSVALLGGFAPRASAQFYDDFSESSSLIDSTGQRGWTCFTGDGQATARLEAQFGIARLAVDATKDRRGIWWAIMKRNVGNSLDWSKIAQGHRALRVEARVRASHPFKRINLHLNTPRTTDFHRHLLEFELARPDHWYTVSMTVDDLDLGQPEPVFAQVALMDWGHDHFTVEVDYLRVDVVDRHSAPADLGDGWPYHPPPPPVSAFTHSVPAAAVAVVDLQEPDACLYDWSVHEGIHSRRVASVGGTLRTVIRWDFFSLGDTPLDGLAWLELSTTHFVGPAQARKDFGQVRIVEILGGQPDWEPESVTLDSLLDGRPMTEVFNTQMIVDGALSHQPAGSAFFPLPPAVWKRLRSGESRGLAVLPLGSLMASFESKGPQAPRLHFTSAKQSSSPSSAHH